MIMWLFTNLYYATQKTLHIIKHFIEKANWHIFVWWWYIFKIWETIHCIDGKKDFWKKKNTSTFLITQHWIIDINWYTYVIEKKRIWNTIRYPQPWDVYKKKRLLKTLLNMKIPVFMRNSTPIVVSKWLIIAIMKPVV